MTVDQWIQVWNAFGTWLAGFATVAAVVVSLYLASRSGKRKLKVHAGVRTLVAGDGTPPQNYVGIDVTNFGNRTVTVNTVGWSVGKRKKRRQCIQTISDRYSATYPIKLPHGKNATFLVLIDSPSDWIVYFSDVFVKDLSDRNLRTLRAQVHTSVGETLAVKVEESLTDLLKHKELRDSEP